MTTPVPNRQYDLQMTRRSIFLGAAASLLCAPAIVRATSLMPVRRLILPIERPHAGQPMPDVWLRMREHKVGYPKLMARVPVTILKIHKGRAPLSARNTTETHCVAEDAVRCEPVSAFEFPANREINREFCQIGPIAVIPTSSQ